jgi:hypothetical protein
MKYGQKNKDGVRVGGARRLIGMCMYFHSIMVQHLALMHTSKGLLSNFGASKNKICITILAC